MIVFNLACGNAHRFEGWFSSSEDFERQAREALISCPMCGSPEIVRQPSAPYVSTRSAVPSVGEEQPSPEVIEFMRRKYKEFIVNNTEDVGARFSEEARRIHYKEVPVRSIRGQASRSEVEELRDEGIEVYSLPGVPVPPDQLH
jgi:hypothetical protein